MENLENNEWMYIAKRCRIKDIVRGIYNPSLSEDSFSPGYVISENGMLLSRICVVGVVVQVFISDDEKYGFVVLDDGTGRIRAKAFSLIKALKKIKKGDTVLVVGRVREYNREVYIYLEGIQKINVNEELFFYLKIIEHVKEFLEMREKIIKIVEEHGIENAEKICVEKGFDKHIVKGIILSLKNKESEEESQIYEKETKDVKDLILQIIKENDTGDGVDYLTIIEKSGIPEDVIDEVVNELLSEGTCYEPKPGKIKIV